MASHGLVLSQCLGFHWTAGHAELGGTVLGQAEGTVLGQVERTVMGEVDSNLRGQGRQSCGA